MHRHTLPLLGALLALPSCQKSSPSAVEAPMRKAALPPTLVPSAAVAVPHDAGVVSAVPVPVLGLAHLDTGPVNHLARARTLRDEGDAVASLAEARRQLADVAEDDEALEMVARGAQSLGQNTL